MIEGESNGGSEDGGGNEDCDESGIENSSPLEWQLTWRRRTQGQVRRLRRLLSRHPLQRSSPRALQMAETISSIVRSSRSVCFYELAFLCATE